ncbi:MAG: hypothetical protein ACOCP4_02475 [Candidatus Woesearchaeota archaeon]
MFIAFEGIDYSGKTSLVSILEKRHSFKKLPRITPGFEKRMNIIHSNQNHKERMDFFIHEIKQRSEYIYKNLKLRKNSYLISDRFLLSLFAYHNVLLKKDLRQEYNLSNIMKPDLYVLCLINEKTLKKRMKMRPPEHKYDNNITYLLKVQEEYKKLIKNENYICLNTGERNISNSIDFILNKLN